MKHADPGIVDQNIHPAKFAIGIAHHVGNLRFIAQVRAMIARRFAILCNGIFGGFHITKSVKDQGSARLRQHLCDA